MAATGTLPAGDFITRAEARAEIGTLVSDQLAAFEAQRQSMAALRADAKSLIDTLAQQADEALKRNQLAAEAQIYQQVGDLREQTVSTVTIVARRRSVRSRSSTMARCSCADPPLWANTVGRGFGERRGGDLMRGGDGASGPVA